MEARAKSALIIALVIVAIIVLSRFAMLPGTKYPSGFVQKATLVAKEARELFQRAKQDSQPLVALLHAEAALTALQTLGTMMSTDHIHRHCNLEVHELVRQIKSFREDKRHELNIAYPGIA